MGKNTRVLVVDDDYDFAQPVVFWLEEKGYSVITAPEGKTALKLIAEEKPDIVFLDLRMPVMDGIETLRRIRESDKRLPVIIITSEYSDPKKFKEVNDLGCSGFFPKKGSLNELIKLIEITLRTHKVINPD